MGFGHATRFGAITANGKGETVLGQVMMLKGANSNNVIKAVKERVLSISKSLPEGVVIKPFIDRSQLIARTTHTIAENLIIGCLIVIFVVVLLLGNFRSGLVVASVIPLCLLFALSLMNIFGIDANLMSLGAIDFGIIIDGAVIIVEFTAYRLTQKKKEHDNLDKNELGNLKDRVTYDGASRMMNSAIFGQLIILIVFIPILSLSGVEGKMFRPMALTFSFALLGAMILCLTYVPVASAVFLKAKEPSKKNISVRLVNFLNRHYEKGIRWALNRRKLVLGVAVGILAISGYVFTTMGGEFIPQLDEGDFVIQPILKTGTSLSKTIETTTKMETILLDSFPEVEQVVSRIGAAEVPTDPMSMEESDVIITLKPKDEWVSADTKEGLADKFKEALSVFPGMEVEFTQPIEMRFNELITGVRADIAIKVFGENLDILNARAQEIKNLIGDVKGAADITVEKVVGLPQMSVDYNREKIARYGLNIADLNKIITMGFAGKTLGSIFEGEKRFDLVLRLKEKNREDIDNLKNLYVDTPMGEKVPLSELAEISYQKGAAKISRDDTQRRIVVGVNVRNRDLESVVKDIQAIVDKNISLPPGYSISYGGQFENLKSATARLKVAVPIALVLIFILLYFAFGTVREALMIYSAIPLAAVGGILLLWIRDMPFSISAGVGFIALFGIAVLNGIVLIEHFKELRNQGKENNDELIISGAQDRLRAVLLTASAAALGFLPMAVSTSAGAEVQRPLATVVIGGLITSTLLTLFVLPVIYSLFHKNKESKEKKQKNDKNRIKPLTLMLFLIGFTGFSQETKTITDFNSLKNIALENNSGLQAASLRVQEANAFRGSALGFDKTEIYRSYDENNLANGEPLRVYGVQQNFNFPTVYFARRKVQRAAYNEQVQTLAIHKRELERDVARIYYQIQYEQAKVNVYRQLDSLYEQFAYAARRRFELGETNYLEKITAQAKQKQLETQLKQAIDDIETSKVQLKPLLQSDISIEFQEQPLVKLEVNVQAIEENPSLSYYTYRTESFAAQATLERQNLYPDISLTYFQGNNDLVQNTFRGYQVGVKIPLLFFGSASRIKAADFAQQAAVQEAQDYKLRLNSQFLSLQKQLEKYQEALYYYENQGQQLSEEIIKTATLSYKSGEIDFFKYIQSLENSYDIILSYYDNLNAFNQTVIRLNYLTL